MARRHLDASPAARALSVVGVAALTLAVVALVALALQQDRSPQTAGEATAGPVPSFSFPGEGSSPSATPTASPSIAAPSAGASERFLARSAEGVLWRATAGACGAVEPVVERSADDGASWSDVTPRYRGISQVRSLSGFGAADAEMIVDLAGCEPQLLRTFTQGRFWELYPDLLARATYPGGSGPVALTTPAGEVALPCATPSSVRVGSQQTALICDGVPQSRVGTGTFAALPVDRAVALDVLGRATAVARIDDAACPDGVALSWIDAAGEVSPAGCVTGVDTAEPVAIAAFDDELIVWAGERVVALPR